VARFVFPDPDAVAVSVDFDMSIDFSTAVLMPAYVTVTTLVLTTLQPSSQLYFLWTSNWFHTGLTAGNIAVNFRFRLNGAILPGGCTDNMVRSQIGGVARNDTIQVTAGVQSLVVEVTRFGGTPAGDLIEIRAALLPDLFHASLKMEEQLA
jgi:hypothetical protein